MSIGPLLSELAQSSENSLFDKFGQVLTFALILIGGIFALVGISRLWKDRHKDDD